MSAPPIAFSTLGCPDWTWQDVLRNGPAYGYDGVEIRMLARETDLLTLDVFGQRNLALCRRELADAGLRVCGLASSVRFDYADAAERQRQVETGRRYLDLAAELEAGFVRVFGDVLPGDRDERSPETVIQQVADGLNTLGDYAAGLKLQVLIETHGDYSQSSVVERTFRLVESPAAGVLWDTHHPWRFFGEPLMQTAGCIGRWTRHTHWKDSVSRSGRAEADRDAVHEAASQAHSLMSGHRHADYVLFGRGEFPASECAGLLRQAGYDGWLCYEWEHAWHPEIEPPEVALPPFPRLMRDLWQQS